MVRKRRVRNIVPKDERGEPKLGSHNGGAKLMVAPNYIEVLGQKNQICIVPGELGDGTPIWSIGMLWKGESTGMSDLPDGPAWCYTFQACRKWIEVHFADRKLIPQGTAT
jgi:hypothetical protein